MGKFMDIFKIMEESCKEHGFSSKCLPSGARHDALEIGQVIPTVLLFVSSKDGRMFLHSVSQSKPETFRVIRTLAEFNTIITNII